MRNASVALSALLLAGASAMAQAPAPAPGNGANPCADDARRLCKGVQPGEGRILGCLKEHREEVSDACKARLAQQRVRPPVRPASRAG